ncbi:MAG: zinc-dependent metalloprotease [Beijerinckiaceae bacterium]|nr:zinc-dependent metalloprotease [Beijerinckiaceae bacterium]
MPSPPFYIYDLLDSESDIRWSASLPLGSPVTITYSFPASQPGDIASNPAVSGYTVFSATEKAATLTALSMISSFTHIQFVEVPANDPLADLRFGNANLTAEGNASGITYYSYNSVDGLVQADIILNTTGPSAVVGGGFVPGSITSADIGCQSWATLLHEIGHALGLKHPFETNANGDLNSILPSSLDSSINTQMSYTQYQPSNVGVASGNSIQYNGLNPSTYSLYDIAALQYLYGSNTTSVGNQTYAFLPDDPVYITISDSGPNNTIDLSALTGANTVDLQGGGRSDLAITQSLPFSINNQYNGTGALTIGYSAQVANVIGGSGADHVNGNSINNTIASGTGNDTINGLAGNDWLTPGAGSDMVDGGADVDMVSFSDLGQAVNASLLNGIATSGPDTDTLSNLENITGTIYSDVLEGDAGANRLRGLGGYDWFVGTGGGDLFEGGTGFDTASYQNATGGVVVNLLTNAGTYGQASGDSYDSIENVTGSSYADIIYGGAGTNNLRGLGGYDTFVGSVGGRERYDGGTGSDTVTYFLSTSGVNASLNLGYGYGYGGDARLDLYTSIENLTGTAHNDILIGDGGSNILRGLAGNDTLSGAGGTDHFTGGRGNDEIDGGAGSDYAYFDGNVADFTITENTFKDVTIAWHGSGAGDGTDHLVDVEYFVFNDQTLNVWML